MLQSAILNNDESIERSPKWVSADALQQEWLEVQAAVQDRAAFRPLYDRYYEPVFRFIFRRSGDEALAADLSSQVFLKAMQRLDAYTFQGVPFSAWLFRIASNEIGQHFRTQQKNRVVSAEDVHLAHLAEEMEEDDEARKHEALLGALDGLPPEEMELVEMRFFEDRPFKEIAEILGISEANAKMRTYRILERMKKNMLHPKPTRNSEI
ncbi:MAG: sigma-70 family RNA polymerase sigma factor [Saprospirales bacterium]|nr:sigma-70 family RNA polymerase sigma factor [Saprospirales bacterium]MBK6904190.1 sigma-70 family RNA polymerase sigma factor [Saprospirales bacterium]MBK7338874.1 sigma-70 family RNA polymerase sigma factor [Saprospirales bacterium]